MKHISSSKKRLLLVAIALIIIFLIVALGQNSSYREHIFANSADGTITFILIKDPSAHLSFLSSSLQLDGRMISECTDDSTDCIDAKVISSFYEYYQIRLDPTVSEHSITWSDTLFGKLFNKPKVSAIYEMPEVSKSPPTPSRIFGRVIDIEEIGIPNSLVVVRSESDVVPVVAGITTENGTYTIAYSHGSDENFLQHITVHSSEGSIKEHMTASFYDQPVADIVIPIRNDVPELELDDKVRTNSCLDIDVTGGIRARCGNSDQWVTTLDTADCPQDTEYFRLGLVKYTSHTQYHRPERVILKLFDETTSSYVADITSGNDLEVRNGGYIYTDRIALQRGRTYAIHAFDGDDECKNISDPSATVTFNTPKGLRSTSSQTTKDGDLPQMPLRADLCSKIGENFGVEFQIPIENMKMATGSRMRWGLALITDLREMDNYAQSVMNGKNIGMNMILRPCYQGNCNINDGSAYGRAIITAYRSLMTSGDLPQNGLFIQGGHNQPNSSEFRDPKVEAQFVADLISVLKGARLLSTDPDDIGIKVISPSFDLYVEKDGVWPGCSDGCTDPDPHSIYTVTTYITEMLQNSAFKAITGDIFAWAVNDHLYERGENNVVSDIDTFSTFISENDLTDRIVITELSKKDTNMNWRILGKTINDLDSMHNVYMIMIFNSLGGNPDISYSYHKDLWNDTSLVSSLFSNCTAVRYQVPQVGSDQ